MAADVDAGAKKNGALVLDWDQNSKYRFLLGGIGACLPLVLQAIALDAPPSLTEGNVVGAGLRSVVLFFLGGFIAYLHSDEVKPIKLIQIGVAAPALATVLATGNAVKQQNTVKQVQAPAAIEERATSASPSFFISSAHAAEGRDSVGARSIQLAGFFNEVVDGFTGKAYRSPVERTVYPVEPEWLVSSEGKIPPGAMPAGKEAPPGGQNLYICRAVLNDGIHPGKIRPEFQGCHIGWGGKEFANLNYQVLVKRQMNWAPSKDGAIPPAAVRAGEEHAPGREPLFICRAQFKDGVHPGKIRGPFQGCHISYGGKEHIVKSYEVLVN